MKRMAFASPIATSQYGLMRTPPYRRARSNSCSSITGVKPAIIEALRNGCPIDDPKLEALRAFAVIINETRGRQTDEQIQAFLSAGHTKENVLEVIVGTSLKVLSNDTTPIVKPEVDTAFAAAAWTRDMALVG